MTGTRRKSAKSVFKVVALILLVGCLCTVALNFFHMGNLVHQLWEDTTAAHALDESHPLAVLHQESHKLNVKKGKKKKKQSKGERIKKKQPKGHHSVAGLDCSDHGGPKENHPVANELVYWKDIESDREYKSPYYQPDRQQYMTFEPDGGGFNNIRMSMETVIVMALAMGRTLVLPPKQHMYLLGKATLDFQDFFPLQAMIDEGLSVITMEEFLKTTKWPDPNNPSQILWPPNNRTKWDGDTNAVKGQLNKWLQRIAINPDWNPSNCIALFPQTANNQTELDELQDMWDNKVLVHGKAPDIVMDYVDNPTPVDGTTLDRIKEFVAGRRQLCKYTVEYQNAPVLHFHGKRQLGGRLLVHSYAFTFFANYHTDLWMKRFVRDHVRYNDELQCAAARIINAIYEQYSTTYDAFHIRRGDFQYKKTRIEATEIYSRTFDLIPNGTIVYVATDERDKKFFDKSAMGEAWKLIYLDNFMHLIKDIDSHYYGMIDQIVATKSRTFVGCWFSTFTGYINRLRGYHTPDNKNGILDSYYYALPEHKNMMRQYWPIKQAFYSREFPTSWWQIDYDVDTKQNNEEIKLKK